MKLLVDFLPIILFFAAYQFGNSHQEATAALLTQQLGFMVTGGVVAAKQAGVFLATLVVMAASVVQISYMKLRGLKIDKMLWVSAVLAVGLGLLTLWFNSETFIQWKPTLLYWVMGFSMIGASLFAGKNAIRAVMSEQIALPEAVWQRLNMMWAAFLILMGTANILVAKNFSTDIWVNFKTFGIIGAMLLFVVVQGLYISRHVQPEEAEVK